MIEIKRVGIESAETTRRLACEIWPVAYGDILSPAQLKYMLEKFYSIASLRHQISILQHHFLFILENKEPAGFASFSAHEENPAIFHLNKIYVLPGRQGKNMGKEAGATSLQLNVNRNNKALHFYEKQGFKIIREEDIDIGNGYFMNDYVMERKVSI